MSFITFHIFWGLSLSFATPNNVIAIPTILSVLQHLNALGEDYLTTLHCGLDDGLHPLHSH